MSRERWLSGRASDGRAEWPPGPHVKVDGKCGKGLARRVGRGTRARARPLPGVVTWKCCNGRGKMDEPDDDGY